MKSDWLHYNSLTDDDASSSSRMLERNDTLDFARSRLDHRTAASD